MAGPFRATFFFECGKYGWSETWASDGTDDFQVTEKLQPLISLRRAMLGSVCSITYIRVSDIGINGDAYITVPPSRSGVGVLPNTADPNLAIVVRCDTGFPYKIRRTWYLRGFDDDTEQQGGNLVMSAAFARAFNAFVKRLTTDNWGMIGNTFSKPGVPITAAAQSANGQITITLSAPPPADYPKQINIFGARKNPALRGRHSIAAPNAGNTVVFNSSHFLRPTTVLGVCQSVTPTLTVLSQCTPIRVSHRITGRPFDSPRGRQLASSR